MKIILFRFFLLVIITILLLSNACKTEKLKIQFKTLSFDWQATNVYFLLTDWFYDETPDNNINFNRTKKRFLPVNYRLL